MLIKFIVVIILHYIHISDHYVVHLKPTQCLYVNYISVKKNKWHALEVSTIKKDS